MDTKGLLKNLDDFVYGFTKRHPKKFIAIMFVLAVWMATFILDILVLGFRVVLSLIK